MCIRPTCLNTLYIADFTLGDRKLNIVSVKKYLGCIIADNLPDNNDINREVPYTYARGHLLIKKFRHCSEDVK